MTIEKMKLKPNEWMESKDFLEKLDYHNLYYFESLGKVFSAYIKTIPIPVLTTWDPVHKRIYVHVGETKRYFEIDDTVNYFDWTLLVHRWLFHFFPRFEVEEEVEVELSDEEIMSKVKEGMKLDDALLLKRNITRKDIGVIDKIQIINDEFVLDRNGSQYIRISGSIDKPLPLSTFLRTLRGVTDDKEKRDYILNYSKEIKTLAEDKKPILVDYPSNMMKNFFVIRYEDIKDFPIEHIYDHQYQWERFKIIFEDDDIERDCLRYVEQKKLEESVEGSVEN